MRYLMIVIALFSSWSCATRAPQVAKPQAAAGRSSIDTLQSLHVRLTVNPDDGVVTYFGWYDGQRNLLGPGGIVAALVGMEPPELQGELKRTGDNEILFEGVDQNGLAWRKRYRLEDRVVRVTYQITSQRNEAFDAIIYSLADLPDGAITGDNTDLYVRTPVARAHFHAAIRNPNFPGEQMNPSALRSDAVRLEPGQSMQFQMTWEIELPGG